MSDLLDNWQTGGCHCGGVRFKVRIRKLQALECNCSICAKKGFINLIAAADDFELLQGEDQLSTYQFNTRLAEHRFCKTCGIHPFCLAEHRFCKTCGIHPFSRPRSHPDGYDINARCLDKGFSFLQIEPFDGQNWEESVGAIQ